MPPKMKNTTFYNFLSTKAEENNNNAGAVPSSSNVSIRNMGPRTSIANYVDRWTFKKELTNSDVESRSKLHLPKGPMLDSILSHLPDGGANVKAGHEETIQIKDVDTGTYHGEMIICTEARVFWLKGHWANDFVNRRDLKPGYLIGLCWNDTVNENGFEFSLLDPK